jgi:hypothetical protein
VTTEETRLTTSIPDEISGLLRVQVRGGRLRRGHGQPPARFFTLPGQPDPHLGPESETGPERSEILSGQQVSMLETFYECNLLYSHNLDRLWVFAPMRHSLPLLNYSRKRACRCYKSFYDFS